ncbi:HNH endonuclease signature motif containing protein [Actinomadura sp. LOL_016]|uniref:HNH endonuclease signature motif containing protein n=1 Tax=unclassified Actinomadura TaxID=2626254 RepID=UPI003A810090
MQRDRLIADIDRCYLCGSTHRREGLVLDHEIPVALDLLKALDARDLKPACESCHRIKSNSEQSLGKRNGSTSIGKGDMVTEIAPRKAKPVYGLTVAAPWHNHLASRVFVCSSNM